MLQGHGPADLEHECLMLAGELMAMTGRMGAAAARDRARELIENGGAFDKLCEIVRTQGGDPAYLRNTALFETSPIQHRVLAPCDGYICRIDTEQVGIASAQLGAGRLAKGDAIDYSAGIELLANYGDPVRCGQPVAILHTSREDLLVQALATFNAALTFGTDEPPAETATLCHGGRERRDLSRSARRRVTPWPHGPHRRPMQPLSSTRKEPTMNLTQSQLAKYMDHTLLKADATLDGIDRVVAEAKQFGCASVCVNPFWVPYVARLLDGSGVATCTVVGFPLGASSTASKVFETTDAIANGADEIDMVINIGELKAGHAELVREDIRAVAEANDAGGELLKVIIECCLLTDDEKRLACLLCAEAGADFVKTSTGFSTGGATVADVALMRECVGPDFGVKAAGGIRTLADAYAMIEAGASRLGVSAAASILAELDE